MERKESEDEGKKNHDNRANDSLLTSNDQGWAEVRTTDDSEHPIICSSCARLGDKRFVVRRREEDFRRRVHRIKPAAPKARDDSTTNEFPASNAMTQYDFMMTRRTSSRACVIGMNR